MTTTRRSYTGEFKIEAVNLVTHKAYSIAEAASRATARSRDRMT